MAYKDGGYLGWMIGRGFGYLIDLGTYITLGDSPKRFIPIMHNGIVYVLVKTGALGLALFLYAFLWLFWRAYRSVNDKNEELRFTARTIQGLVSCCLISAWVVGGPFSKSNFIAIMFLLGFLLAVLEKNDRQKESN
jgi:O-antigen ligase